MELKEGLRIGKWELISQTKKGIHRAWMCRCDCGTIKPIPEFTLKGGGSDRCRQCYLKGPRVPREFLHEIGHRFGSLVIIDRIKDGQRSIYSMRCDCGAIVMMQAGMVNFKKNQMCRKCGLATRGHTVHGMAHSPTYSVWEGMKRRCHNPRSPKYEYYGGKGIQVCERWHKFPNFLADMGERPEGLVIDRIDSDGNYEPGNCRWVTAKENNDKAHEVKMRNNRPYRVQVD